MLGFDIRGDATRGDFDGVGDGTLARTFGPAAAVAQVQVAISAASAALPDGSLKIGLLVLVGVILYAYRRVL
jgi:hypothetical protein